MIYFLLQEAEVLPKEWNKSKEYYDLFYIRAETKFRLEVYVVDDLMHLQFKVSRRAFAS